jgi:hypothetical protein
VVLWTVGKNYPEFCSKEEVSGSQSSKNGRDQIDQSELPWCVNPGPLGGEPAAGNPSRFPVTSGCKPQIDTINNIHFKTPRKSIVYQ